MAKNTSKKLKELFSIEAVGTQAAEGLSDLLKNSFVSNDGSGTYVSLAADPMDEDNYLSASVPVLDSDEGANAKWVMWDTNGSFSTVSDSLDASADSISVLAWFEEQREVFVKARALF